MVPEVTAGVLGGSIAGGGSAKKLENVWFVCRNGYVCHLFGFVLVKYTSCAWINGVLSVSLDVVAAYV